MIEADVRHRGDLAVRGIDERACSLVDLVHLVVAMADDGGVKLRRYRALVNGVRHSFCFGDPLSCAGVDPAGEFDDLLELDAGIETEEGIMVGAPVP